MSDFNSLVYDIVEGKTASSLDRVRDLFYGLFNKMRGSQSPVQTEKIDNSFLFYTGYDLAFFNAATIFDGNAETLEKIMQRIDAWKSKHQITLGGAGLAQAGVLEERGYKYKWATPFMGMAVDDRFSNFTLRPGLTVVRTNNQSQIKINTEMLVSTFSLPQEIVNMFCSTMLENPDAFRYVIYDNGTPVSTSLFIKDGDFLGCFDVATPAEHQRKGYGEELMKYMLKEQFEIGSKLVVLQSSAAGQSLYRRMGYQIIEYGQVWGPKE